MKINNTAVIEELENKLVKVTINNKSYGARFNKGHRNLVVMREPEEDEKLRTKSVFIQDKDLPIIRKFMQTYLLSTMYMEGGIGIAAIQVGLPIDGNKSDYWKWFSRCAQHEFDHTEGILFTDKLYNSIADLTERGKSDNRPRAR
ncbi:MAG: peptide deformylase [Rickettsiaceae bacterium]